MIFDYTKIRTRRLIQLVLLSFSCFITSPIILSAQDLSYYCLTDSIFSIIKQHQIPGLTVAVVSKDSVFYRNSFGYTDLSTGVKVNDQTRFLQGSVTKTFTAMAIMSLVQSGKLDLEDELKIIAPEIYFENKWEDTQPIRLKHILEHKAGFDDMHINTFGVGEGEYMTALEKALIYKRSYVSRWEPGLVSSYSNPGYSILGFIIEKKSGMLYRDYVRQAVLDPLEMNRTMYISEISEGTDNVAKAHEYNESEYVPIETYQGPKEAGGGLMSTQSDMIQFVQYLLNKKQQDSINLLSTKLVSEMESLHGWFDTENNIMYGYGLGIDLCDSEINDICYLGHSGGLIGASAHYLYNYDYDIGITIANNSGQSNRQIIELLISNYTDKIAPIKATKSIKNSEIEIEEWDGDYYPVKERNGIYSFINAPFNTIHIDVKGDSVALSYYMEGCTNYKRYIENALISEGEVTPGVYLTKTHDQPSLRFYQNYYKKVNGPILYSIRSVGIFGIIGSLLLIVIALIQFIGSYRYSKWNGLYKFSILIAAPILMALVSVGVLATQSSLEDYQSFSEVGFSSIIVFITTMAMPFFSLFGMYYLIKKRDTIKSKILFAIYLLISTAGMVIIGYCVYNGWFAFRIWAY